MEIDSASSEQSNKQKAEAFQALINGPLSSSISKLSSSSRVIPYNEDFHFCNNFEEFKTPVKEISEKSKLMLKCIGFSKFPLGKPFPFPDDSDESHDWLVDLNDEIFERLDSSVDEFQRVRKKEEETGRRISSVDESGFQLVCRKNKKGFNNDMEKEEAKFLSPSSSVKMASRDKKTTGAKPKVPFHIPSIPRPQAEYNIHVNNFNQPFEHVWLEKSEDGCRFIHPLENHSMLNFVDRNIGDVEPIKPLPLESTPFMLIEDVKQLKELAKKLRDVNEFAVDLEHNQYRSFQGMTCLMQISTRTEDFVVDTLKLRVQVGPYLREVFKDPSKKKVMHGADRDIVWLQRDFGIYMCNLFDTGQASRVLQLERNSLEFLLHHFCRVTANKEYQNADWRIRPIPDEMLRYAREDTHYLLHIFDLMKASLLSASTSSENGEDLLLEVYKRSCVICMQLYEKELLTDTSYLYIYGLQDADFNSQQLAIVAGLCEWRDGIARAEDESTGYILPNKAVLEIARQMPLSASKLRQLAKSKHPYVEHHLPRVVDIIRNSIQNAYAFESAAEQLKGRTEMASKPYMEVIPGEFEALPASEDPTEMEATPTQPESVYGEVSNRVNGVAPREASVYVKEETSKMGNSRVLYFQQSFVGVGESEKKENNSAPAQSKESTGASNTEIGSVYLKKDVPEATVQVLKKPNRAFGALLGNSGSKRKLDPHAKDKAESKVEQIKSSVTLPFHSFSGKAEQSTSLAGESAKPLEIPTSREPVPEPAEVTKLDEINSMESGSTGLELDTDDEPMSLSELSTSFQKCFQPKVETRNTRQVERTQELGIGVQQLKPFDYAAAREQHRWFAAKDREGKKETEDGEGLKSQTDSKERRKKPIMIRMPTEEEAKEFQQARRRQAFPQSGNRSTTFR